VNVSLGLGSEAGGAIPDELIAVCAERHKFMPQVCPPHMFGPPSYVQGAVEEYLDEWVLLLELQSREPIGHMFGEGVLQFMIRPADLREHKFDKIRVIASAY